LTITFGVQIDYHDIGIVGIVWVKKLSQKVTNE